MGISLILPTPHDLATEDVWGPVINAALQALADTDIIKEKSTHEGLTANTTLQDDNTFQNITLTPGTWLVDCLFLVSGPSGADIQITWAFSGTLTRGSRGGQGPAAGVTSALDGGSVRMAGANNSGQITGIPVYGTDGTNWSAIVEKGVLVVSATGTLKVQWAQNVSDAGTTNMRAGSFVHCKKVA